MQNNQIAKKLAPQKPFRPAVLKKWYKWFPGCVQMGYLSCNEVSMIRSPYFQKSLLIQMELLHCDNDDQDNVLRIYADGQVGVVFYTGDQRVTFNGRVCAPLFAYGQTLKPLEIRSGGKFSLLVAYLQPIALHAYFALKASELTDNCLDFKHIDRHLTTRLIVADSWQKRQELLTNYLLNIDSEGYYKTDTRIHEAAAEIITRSGSVRPGELYRRLSMTERTFERQFLKHVGITSAAYCRVCRFKSALQLLHNPGAVDLPGVAYHSGYADQSHFIRNFKEFTAVTPTQFLSKRANAALYGL